MLSPVSSLVLFKKSFSSFCRFLLPNQFHLKPAPFQPPPPHHHSLSHLSLCVAASSEKCLILPLSGVRERSEEEGQPFSLSLLSALPFLRCAYPPSSKLLFSSLFISFLFSPHLFGFPFFLWHAVSRLLSPALADESNTRPP